MKVFSSPVIWIFLGAFLSALAAITAAITGWTTLRQPDVQIETVKAWMTGGDSIVYFEPPRRDGHLAFYIRHAGVYPAYDVTIRVHEVLDGAGSARRRATTSRHGQRWERHGLLGRVPDAP